MNSAVLSRLLTNGVVGRCRNLFNAALCSKTFTAKVSLNNFSSNHTNNSIRQPFQKVFTQHLKNLHTTTAWYQFSDKELGDAYCISYENLKSGAENGEVQVIDVRRKDEVDAGIIQAKRWAHIPVEEVAEAFALEDEDFKDKYGFNKPSKDASDIVFHCKLGGRSTFAMKAAQNAGYSKARHYPGGWSEWSEKNQ